MTPLRYAQALTRNEVLLFFLVANFLYVFPLIQADYFYNDDNWRVLIGGGGWREEGRAAIGFFYNIVSFSSKAPDMFPLPLFIATATLSLALRDLTFFYFERPGFAHCLVVLPIWYNPAFLQNLSYRYDGPTMTLGLVALIYAVIWQRRRLWSDIGGAALLIALALSFYQLLIGFFIALCCVEVIRRVWEGQTPEVILAFIGRKSMAIAIAVLVYYATTYQWMSGLRQPMLALEINSLLEIRERVFQVGRMLSGWGAEGVRPLVWCGTVLVVIGYAWAGFNLLRRPENLWRKTVLVTAYLLAAPVLLMCIPGITVFFAYFNKGTRTLAALSALLLLMFFFSFQMLTRLHARLGVVLLVPLLAMLSFSFGHGRVLALQKEQESAVLASLAYDITHSSLRDQNSIYMIPEPTADWLPAASGAFAAMPTLKQIVGVGYVLLPEALPRAGITNVYLAKDPGMIAALRRGDYPPVVSTLFYDLYVIHDSGYIFMKKPQANPDVVPKLCLITDIEQCH
ncbi:glucosyltransferase domain-containing protein [Pseudomonas citri]|uniref:glucosyltransferase domain-containing protein n=1 Tax=Pseudomonas citri TaxID=2978349 RepID=UPI0021B5E399|nr:glucosyltransferase domain-containing protein [Pseudomonas citri]